MILKLTGKGKFIAWLAKGNARWRVAIFLMKYVPGFRLKGGEKDVGEMS